MLHRSSCYSFPLLPIGSLPPPPPTSQPPLLSYIPLYTVFHLSCGLPFSLRPNFGLPFPLTPNCFIACAFLVIHAAFAINQSINQSIIQLPTKPRPGGSDARACCRWSSPCNKRCGQAEDILTTPMFRPIETQGIPHFCLLRVKTVI